MGCIIMKEKVPICMKGSLIINKKNRKPVTIVILILLSLSFVGMAAAAIMGPMRYSNANQENEFTLPEIAGNGSDGFVAHMQSSASVPAMTGIELMKAGTHTSTICCGIECTTYTNKYFRRKG